MVTVLNKQLTELTGESLYTLTGFDDYPLYALKIYGKSTQNGTPTPDTPIDIVSVGDDGAVKVTACSKNLYDPSAATAGYVTTAGAIANDTNYLLSDYISCRNASYITVSGIVSGSVWYRIAKYDKNKKFIVRLAEANVQTGAYTFDVSDCDFFNLSYENVPATNSVVTDVQIEYGATATAYEPYKGNSVEITSGLPLCSVGDCRDELVFNADGTGEIIKRTAKIDSYNSETITTDYISSTGGLDVDATIVYVLENPIGIELTVAEMVKLQQLRTLEGVTNLYNSDNGEMYIRAMTAGFEYGHEVGFFDSKV